MKTILNVLEIAEITKDGSKNLLKCYAKSGGGMLIVLEDELGQESEPCWCEIKTNENGEKYLDAFGVKVSEFHKPTTEEITPKVYTYEPETLLARTFIITHEHRYAGKAEPCGRPALGKVVQIDKLKNEFMVETHDYELGFDHTCRYDLPTRLGESRDSHYHFDIVSEHNGRDLVTRFWEV